MSTRKTTKKAPNTRVTEASPAALYNATAQTLLSELQAHQVELEMQNEALREAQIALEESRDRYADLYEFAPVGYLTLNVHGLIEDINLTGAKLLNQERQKLLQMPFAEYVVQPDQKGWLGFFQQALMNGDNLTGEVDLKRDDGLPVTVRLTCMAIRSGDAVKGLRITLSNITDLKIALDDLNIREDRLQLAQVASDLGVFDDDFVSGVHMVDARIREIWGFSLTEPVSLQQVIAGVHPEDHRMLQGALARARSTAGTGKYAAQYRVINGVDGTVHHVSAKGQVIFAQGRVVRFVGTVKDISEQIQMQAALGAQRKALDLLVHQQIALHTAMAIAHDINQPLVSISAYSEAAMQMLGECTNYPDKLKRALQGAVEQAHSAGGRLHELLDFLHQGESVTDVMDLNEVVREAIDMVGTGVCQLPEFVFQPEPDLPMVRINRLQVQKAVINLLQNACDAMSTAVPADKMCDLSVRVSVQRMSDLPMALVSVHDSGPGFNPDTIGRAFEPFFTTKSHGIGLGLAISRALIEANGGQLWVNPGPFPGPDRGATLHFSLPLT